jgi:hypothetical protein
MWRSLVARSVRDAEVAGSNPVIPTIITDKEVLMAESEIPKGLIEHAHRRTEIDEALSADERQAVVNLASRIVDILTGGHNIASLSEISEGSLATAPPEIPNVTWSRMSTRHPKDDYHANLGGFVAEKHFDEKPSLLINAAFYAGVIAGRDGLLDTAPFHHD